MVKKYVCNICGRELEAHSFIRVQVHYLVYDRERKKCRYEKVLTHLKRGGEDYCPECAGRLAERLMKAIGEVMSRADLLRAKKTVEVEDILRTLS